VHLASATAFSVVHTVAILTTRALLFPYGGRVQASVSWGAYLQRNYLMQLDWMIATYFFLVGLGHAVEYWHEAEERAVNSERLQRQLAEAQLRALERQLHPHFLFNTLHTVSALMRSDVDAADDIIDRLSDLLRLSLRQRGQEVTVRDELELLRKYLDIEQMRFRDRLAVSVDIAEETLDAMVPHFVLQPIVENAVRHGIAPRARAGRVDIRALHDSGDLRLEVYDTGDGVPETQLVALNHGIGLGNTRARLEHLYGASQRLMCENVAGGGFRVSITIPFRTERRIVDPPVGVSEEVA
jgi:LytS/YehU family sensor histidine kinase